MMFENKTIIEYYYTKFLFSYLYDDEIFNNAKKSIYDFYIFNDDFLSILVSFIEMYVSRQYAYSDLSIRKRLYELISYIKYNAEYDDENVKKYYNEIFYNMIIKLNRYKESQDNYSWIIKEYQIRKDTKIGSKITLEEYEKIEKFVKKSLGYDFILLTYLSDEVDDKTFEGTLESLSNDEFCFASLNIIIKQCPEFLDIPLFNERVKKLIKYNRKNFKSLKDESLKNKVYIIRQNIKYSIKFKS